jgi:hypothetical protein
MAAQRLPDHLAAEAARLWRKHGGNDSDAARELGISRSTFVHRRQAAAERGMLAEPAGQRPVVRVKAGRRETLDPEPLPETDDASLRLLRLDTQRRRDAAEMAALRLRLAEQNMLLDTVLGIARHQTEVPEWLPLPRDVKTTTAEVVPFFPLSDVHLGERVDRAEVDGANEYTIEIARRRFRLWVDRGIGLVTGLLEHEKHRTAGCIVPLMGDIVSGAIHEELARTNELTDTEQVFEAVGLIVAALKEFARAFGRIHVPAVFGNHGRLTRKPWAKLAGRMNADYMIYRFVERELRDDARFSFLMPLSGRVFASCSGYRYQLIHGDKRSLAAFGGTGAMGSMGPIMRGQMRQQARAAAIRNPLDHIVMGHFHQLALLHQMTVLPAFVGPSEYSVNDLGAIPEPPAALCWQHHPRFGPVHRLPIFLTDGAPGAAGDPVALMPADYSRAA